MFRTLLENEIKRKNLSVREAAAEIGVSHTTIYQILRDRATDIETASKVCKWLGVSIDTIFGETTKTDSTAAMVSTILKHFPELEAVFNQCADEVVKGTMTEEDFQAVIEFAAFQMQKRRGQAKKDIRPEAPEHSEEQA